MSAVEVPSTSEQEDPNPATKRPTTLQIPSTLPTDLDSESGSTADEGVGACGASSSLDEEMHSEDLIKIQAPELTPAQSPTRGESMKFKDCVSSDASKFLQWTSNLKRSNSAPLVNLVGRSPSPRGGHFVPKVLFSPGPGNRASSPSVVRSVSVQQRPGPGSEGKGGAEPSSRIFSHPVASSPNSLPVTFSPIRIPSKRIQNIRRESNVAGCILSDVERERLFRSSAQMSSSFETFGLDEGGVSEKRRSRAQSLTEPISILTHFLPSSGSPSPTRVDSQKQCYSPSTQQIVRSNIAFSPRPSPRSTPSPTRQKMIRSLSPIAVLNRPNRKRKMENGELEGLDSPKRFNGITATWCSAPRTPTYDRSLPSFQPPGEIDSKPSILASSFETESNDSVGSSDCRASSTSSATGFAFPCVNYKAPDELPPPIPPTPNLIAPDSMEESC